MDAINDVVQQTELLERTVCIDTPVFSRIDKFWNPRGEDTDHYTIEDLREALTEFVDCDLTVGETRCQSSLARDKSNAAVTIAKQSDHFEEFWAVWLCIIKSLFTTQFNKDISAWYHFKGSNNC